MRKLARGLGVLAGAAALLTASGGLEPAQSQMFMSKKQERKIGAREHPKLLQEFGGALKDDAKSGYVAQVGGRMSANSEMAGEQFTFTLLNSSIINAFALPGGYVYISRQLMGLMNDEAELASVLGHEVGHVTARHTAKRYDRQILSTVLAIGAGVATGSGDVANLVGQASQAYVLSYSRNQEFQSDDRGIRYMSKGGYDPYAAASMLASLGAQTSLDGRIMGRDYEKVPAWARTHPLTSDRVGRAFKRAQETKIAQGANPRHRDRFLDTINGMLMDDDAEQGFVRGRTFAHTKLLFTFSAPEGFVLQNSSDAVGLIGPGDARGQFSGAALPAATSMNDYVAAIWRNVLGQNAQQVQLPQPTRTEVNGMEAAISTARLNSQSGPVDVMIAAYRYAPGTGYHLIVMSPAGQTAAIDSGLRQMVQSFRKLTTQEAGAFQERRIRVVTVQPGQTAEQLARQMAYTDYQIDRFLVLNALRAPTDLKAGQRVKLIAYPQPRG